MVRKRRKRCPQRENDCRFCRVGRLISQYIGFFSKQLRRNHNYRLLKTSPRCPASSERSAQTIAQRQEGHARGHILVFDSIAHRMRSEVQHNEKFLSIAIFLTICIIIRATFSIIVFLPHMVLNEWASMSL